MDSLNTIVAPSTKYVAVYFTADYCKWCKDFTPILERVYGLLVENNIEVIHVGSDKTELAYNVYASKFAWPHLQFSDSLRQSLRDMFGIKTIPALIIFDREWNIIDADGRNTITDYFNGTSKKLEDLFNPSIYNTGTIDYDSDDDF
jgi:thiol-disulfide isomerase/thioredoxin